MSEEKENYPGLNLMKEITASITIFFCLILIITYFISFLQVKFNILIKEEDISKEIRRASRYSHSSFIENTGLEIKDEGKKPKKIGLGSHYMFFLILSNFLGGISELIYIISENKNKYSKDTENVECIIFGFLHNFLDLSSVCWTTMLTYLFYKSTNLSSEILFKDEKYLLIGFLYWFFSCGIFCVVPLIEKCYGFSSTYCSFRRVKEDKNEIELKIWIFSFIIIVILNSIFNCICLYKTTIFYSKKLKILKTQNIKEYKLIRIYVRVFQIFPIVLVITRALKLMPVILLKLFGEKFITKIFVYLNAFAFNLNGTFNSLSCIYFFRGVFWCCFSSNDKDDDDDVIDKDKNNSKKNLPNNDLYEPLDNSNELNKTT